MIIRVDEKPVPLIDDARERILPENPGDILKKDGSLWIPGSCQKAGIH